MAKAPPDPPSPIHKGKDRQLEFFSCLHEAQRFAVALGLAHAKVTQSALFGVTPFLLAQHHTSLAIEAGQTAHDGQVICKVAVTVHLHKIGEDAVDVIESVRTLGVTRNFGDLPGAQVAVNVFGQLLAFLTQLINFKGDVHRRVGLHISQLVDLGFEFGNGLLKIKKCFFGQV